MKPTACIRDAERSTAGAWSATATAGAILSATAASACCVGPLVLALLGLGGAGLLLKFEPYRPYFVALTVGLLATGFLLAYRKPAVACACERPKRNRLGRTLPWVASVVVVALLALPYLAPYLFQ